MQLQVRCPNCFEMIDFGDGVSQYSDAAGQYSDGAGQYSDGVSQHGDAEGQHGTGQAVLCPTCGGHVRFGSDNQPGLELELADEMGTQFESDAPASATFEPQKSQTFEARNTVWDSVEIRPKVRPKAPSLAKRIIPPILGGLASVPISLAILWYGFGRDIGNAGPSVAKFAPWLVPEALRGGIRKRVTTPEGSHRRSTDDRRFGAVGSQSRNSSSTPEWPAPQGISRTAPEPQIASPGARDLITTIQQLHDNWETNPVEIRPQMLAAVYGKVRALVAESGIGSLADDDDDSELRESIRNLLNQSWFVESIEEATAGNLPDLYSPVVLDYVALAAEAVQWHAGDTIPRQLHMSPSPRIRSKDVQMVADESLMKWLPEQGTDGSEKRYLILGQIIGRDALGYTVRVDAVLP